MMKVGSEIEENYFEKNRLFKYKNNSQKHEFDRELRLLNLEILEKIELNFKKYLIIFFEQNGGVKNEELYIPKYLEITLDFIRNKEESFKNYDNDIKKDLLLNNKISVFVFIEKLTFGEVNKLFRALNIKYKKNITKNYGINVFIFSSWIYSLKYLRNLCSHSENVYNRTMLYEIAGLEVINFFGVNTSYVSYFLALSLFEKNILNSNLWQKKVLKLLEINKISIAEISLNKKIAPPVSLKSEAWEALVNTLYKKMIKKSKVFQEKTKKINIILALDEQNGLGKDGDLAWRIREDMQYFKEVTTYPQPLPCKEGGICQNAVIMGRKTWDSIPEKYRPLPDRINCILSRKFDFEDNFGNICKYNSFESAIDKLSAREDIGNLFIIGGAQIYNQALKMDNLSKVYLTRVKGNYDCDVFVEFREEDFELVENSDWKKNKKGIEFRFEVWKRK